MDNRLPLSIIIPCLNEEKFIAGCLDSVLANDYPQDQLEVLVIDGMSEDNTRTILSKYVNEYPRITCLDNPDRITPRALNIAIAEAKGDVIMRMDAHTTYDREYISKCMRALEENEADNVGGIWEIVPRDQTLIGRSIVKCLSHVFGIGTAYYRLGASQRPRWVDTVPFFCCKKAVFQDIGVFNEKLRRGQDMEFNLRMKKAGYRTLLVPSISSRYFARSDMKTFCQHNWTNGVWAILPFYYSDVVPVSPRHLIPLFFALGILGTACMALLSQVGVWLFLAILGTYVAANLTASASIAMREGDPRYLLTMPIIFASLHFGYGFGSVWGVVQLLVQAVSDGGWRHKAGEVS